MGELLFRVYQRSGRSGQKTWTVRFFESSGKVLKTLSLPQALSQRQAEKVARDHLRQGLVASQEDPIVKDYLLSFWRMDSSYAKMALLQGRSLSERYVYDCLCAVRVHLIPFLESRRMSQLNLGFVDDWILDRVSAGAGRHRVNTALKALHVAVKYFCRAQRIPDLLSGIQKVQEKPVSREILSNDEMTRLLEVDTSPRIRVALLLAAFCGLRAGEIRGLQWSDVQGEDKTLLIRHNYVSDREGLKKPKWQKDRRVPLPDVVLSALEVVREENLISSPYVLFNEGRIDRPMERCTITRGFHRVLDSIGIDHAQRTHRHLCLHGLRNLFVSYSRSIGIPDYVVQRLVGHSTLEMTDHYTRVNITDFSSARAKLNDGVSPLTNAGTRQEVL